MGAWPLKHWWQKAVYVYGWVALVLLVLQIAFAITFLSIFGSGGVP